MGISPEVKLFLQRLFPECFSQTTNERFDISILEGMPYFAVKILTLQNGNQTMHQLAVTLKQQIYNVLTDVNVERGVVLLLDNFYHVPGNKSLVEKKRDNSKSDEPDSTSNKTWLNEDEYLELRKKKNLNENDLIYENTEQSLDTKGIYLWRDINLRWLIHRLLSLELLKIQVPEGKFLLIDEGIFLSKEEVKSKSKEILENHEMNKEEISLFDKQTFISYEMKNEMKSAFVFPEHRVRYENSNKIGESDLKILSHIKRTENNDSYIVCSPDGDILLMLLLHMKSILNPITFEFDNKVYLDTQTTGDKSKGTNRDYRYINITLLYHKILVFFQNEFKSIIYPIETFSMLFLSYFSDYTENIKLQAGPSKIWNTFASLHCTNNFGYIPFSAKKIAEIQKNSNTPGLVFERHKAINSISPSKDFIGILNKSIQLVSYDNQELLNINKFNKNSTKRKMGFFATLFYFEINVESFISFFNYLYQQPLLPKFKKEGIIKNLYPIFDYNQLLIYAKKYQEKLNPTPIESRKKPFFNNNHNLDISKAQDIISQLTNNPIKKTGTKQQQSSISSIREKNFNNKNTLVIANLLEPDLSDSKLKKPKEKKPLALLCGLPSYNDLVTRVISLKWVCNYFQNGWKWGRFTQSYYECYDKNTNLSINGWRLKPFDKSVSEQSISSNYLVRIRNPFWKIDYEQSGDSNPFNYIYKLSTVETAQVLYVKK
jgi:hypothetical protein